MVEEQAPGGMKQERDGMVEIILGLEEEMCMPQVMVGGKLFLKINK